MVLQTDNRHKMDKVCEEERYANHREKGDHSGGSMHCV